MSFNKLNTNNFAFSNLQIGDRDIVGNKFNGHDLHIYLRERGIDSKHLVFEKESNDINTFTVNNDSKTREFNILAEEKYNIHSFSHYCTYDILYNKLFLDSDIIHMHLIHNNMFNMHLLPIMSRMKPIILTLHDPWLLSGHCVHHFNCLKWQNGCGDCDFLDIRFPVNNDNTALIFEMKRDIIERSNISFITPSMWLENKLKMSPIFKNKKIYTLPFGINQEIFKQADTYIIREELGIDKDSVVLMCRADDNIYKGLDIIKKALTEIKTNKKITVITTADKNMLDDLKDKVNVLDYGWVKSDELLAKLYQAADIFLMPSRAETFGMMAIEAMSCGKMVLALEATSVLTEVINSPESSLACGENEYSLTLERIINNREYIDRGKKSFEFAKKNYTKDIYINKIINVYKEVIHGHKADEKAFYVLNQLSKNYSNYLNLPIDHDKLNSSYLKSIDELTKDNNILNKENNMLYKEKEEMKLKISWFNIFSISNNLDYLRITIFGIKFTFRASKKNINKIAWFIPFSKLRTLFRKKFI